MTTKREQFDNLVHRLAAQKRLPDLGERRRLRETHGISLRSAGAATGASPTAISAWESGRYMPRGQHLLAYLDFLDLLMKMEEPSA